MRISKPSTNSALLLFGLLACGVALAQDSARQDIQAEGDRAMQRLKGSIVRQKKDIADAQHPTLPVAPTEEARRRAFDQLRRRAPMPETEARAREALAQGEARLAEQREAMARRLRQALGLEPGQGEALAKASPRAPASWVPVIFASSSIPLPVLRAYAAQLERVQGVLAFRGMPGGLRKVSPMAKLTAEILRLDPGCEGPACAMRNVQVIIDPVVFRQHAIARVPALAILPGDPTQPYCERDAESPSSQYVVYGDSALRGLFDEYARLGGKREVEHAQALLGTR